MNKLWETENRLDQLIERYTVGNDYELDQVLIPYDCRASQAHVRMLAKIEFIDQKESEALIDALDEIIELNKKNQFRISVEDEDGHTAIENYLVRKLGEAGKKVHTGRSRNDQVLTAIRLYEKDQVTGLISMLGDLYTTMTTFGEAYGEYPLPGYTHTRKAMPYTIGKWIGAFKDALNHDVEMLKLSLKLIDENPLGTGAGYGVPVPLQRGMTTEDLGFASVMTNSLHAQNSRGKLESVILHNCLMILYDLNKWSSDLILFTMPELDYFKIDNSHVTGSSIMPHKKNPDVLELIRASYSVVNGYEMQTRNLSVNLISGYHRDLQWTKEPLMRGLELSASTIAVCKQVLEGLTPNKEKLDASMTPEMLSVQEIIKLVEQGMPFREAYRVIAGKYR